MAQKQGIAKEMQMFDTLYLIIILGDYKYII